MNRPFDIEYWRAQMPITRSVAYLNHSSTAPLATSVQQAIAESAAYQADGSLRTSEMKTRIASLKTSLAALIHASVDEIALVRNTTEGLNTVASGVMWRKGDTVVTDDIEFPANVYPWLNQQSRYGVTTRLVPARDGRVLVDDLIAACDARTRLITVSFVQFSNGYRIDLAKLGAFCRDRGILLCVDAIQGLGVLPVDVERDGIDFLAAGAHKWLLGPMGVGFLYIRRSRQADLWPSDLSHFGVLQDERSLLHYDLTFRPTAEKFEGGLPNYAGIFGLDAALKLLGKVGFEIIHERVLVLTDYLCETLDRAGYRIRSSRTESDKSATVAFDSPRVASDELLPRLDAAGVVVSKREGAIRVAPHFYNTLDEIDRLVAALPRL